MQRMLENVLKFVSINRKC